jgi:hypothetical protein
MCIAVAMDEKRSILFNAECLFIYHDVYLCAFKYNPVKRTVYKTDFC